MRSTILVVDDDADFRELLELWLEGFGHRAIGVASAEAAVPHLDDPELDVVLTDHELVGMSGLELCAAVAAHNSNLPVVMLTAFGSMETAIGAIRAGAYDFVTKPCDKDHLQVVLDRALRHRDLQRQVSRLEQRLERTTRIENIIGESPAIRKMADLISRVADTTTTVLVQGESGTGKELVARALHAKSRRAQGPFVAVNCAALPAPLLESEMFGHVAGAFTDARGERRGLLCQADGGTLFLDEIGEMPLEMQVKLLRALQERTVRPVGGTEEVAFDARLVAATNRELAAAVEAGTFREDLYYRLDVVRIEAPPLRQRAGDVLLLAQSFLEAAAARLDKGVVGLSDDAARRLTDYAWPGNVRELENCIESAVALTTDERIAVQDLPERLRSYRPKVSSLPANSPQALPTLQEMEERYVLEVLDAVGGNKSAAARVLGVDRRTLYRKLEAISVPGTREA